MTGWEKLCGDAGVVQFSALATDLAGLAITFSPDLGVETEELVARGDVADGAVEAVVVVVVDASGDRGAGAVGRDGLDGALFKGPVIRPCAPGGP